MLLRYSYIEPLEWFQTPVGRFSLEMELESLTKTGISGYTVVMTVIKIRTFLLFKNFEHVAKTWLNLKDLGRY
jgi:hypothetical protein